LGFFKIARSDDRFALSPYRHGYFAAMEKREAVGGFGKLVHRDFQTSR